VNVTVIALDDVLVTVAALKPFPEKSAIKKSSEGVTGAESAKPVLVPVASELTTGTFDVNLTVA